MMPLAALTIAALAGCNAMSTPGTAAGDGGATTDARAGVGEPPELVGITLYHNQVRAQVDTTGVAGGALPDLAWDASLAATAAAYVMGCPDADHDGLVDHNPNRSVGHPFYVGENIYASTGTAGARGAVDAWASEASHYHYGGNTCDAGQVCGHYTQLVWRDTQKVGCALFSCASKGLKYPSTIVCDYGPGGNIGSQPPY